MTKFAISVAACLLAAISSDVFKLTRAALDDKPEYTNWENCVKTVGDTILESGGVGQDPNGPAYLYDDNLFTYYEVPESLPDEQWIKYDLSAYGPQKFKGVLFHTYEERMTSGTVKFFVDGVECPDTLGVGVNAIGGVFNCNLKGNVFEARCTAVCSPGLSVIEMQVYAYSILTVEGTAYALDGNVAHSKYSFDHDKLWKTGSFFSKTGVNDWCSCVHNVYAASRGTGA